MKWKPGAHGTTFGGNPVCCAAALATLDIVEQELLPNVNKMGDRLISGARRLQEKYRRHRRRPRTGLMVGVEFVKDRATREPRPTFRTSWSNRASRRAVCSWVRQKLAPARTAACGGRVRRRHRPPDHRRVPARDVGLASKVMSMQDAVARHVRDGDVVVIEGFTHLISFAAGHEIIRQRAAT